MAAALSHLGYYQGSLILINLWGGASLGISLSSDCNKMPEAFVGEKF